MVKKALQLLGIGLISAFIVAFPAIAARTDGLWDNISSNVIKPNPSGGADLLIYGNNRYVNFGASAGSLGYGIRDNAGVMECKDSGGSWSACQDGTGSAVFPFTAQSYGVSTSSVVNFTAGLMAGTSTFTGALTFNSLTLGGLGVSGTGLVYKYATTTYSGGLTYLNGNVTNDMTNIFTYYASTFATTTPALSLPNSGMLGFMGNAAVTTSNYSLLGNTTLTLLNARSGGSIGFRINNTDVANFNTSGGYGFGSTYYNINAGQNNMIVEGILGVGVSAPVYNLDVAGLGHFTGLVDASKFTATSSTLASSFPQYTFTNATGTSVYASASSTFQILNAGTLALQTALTVANGGTGATTLTGCLTGNGTGAITGSGTCYTGAGANPSATIGLTANNGVATTFMRSDATPALGVAITPTWSALHIWSGTGGIIARASSTIQWLSSTNSTSTNATSTAFSANQAIFTSASSTGATTTSLYVGNQSIFKGALTALNTVLGTVLGAVDLGGATSFEIVNGSAPVVDAIGEVALDTTDNQLLVATSTDASFPTVIRGNERLFSFKIASTSIAYSSTSMKFPPEKDGYTITSISCAVEGGTSVSVLLTDANSTNDTGANTCTTANTNFAITANGTWTAGEEMRMELSSKTGTIDWVNFSAFGVWTRE